MQVGILPPAFFGHSSKNDEIEGEIYSEIRRYIRSRRNLVLSFDYSAKHRAGPLDVHAVWQGNVVNKIPDKAKIQVIGEELETDILVLTWVGAAARLGARIEISLYVFGVARGKMYQGTDDWVRIKTLVASTFALSDVFK